MIREEAVFFEVSAVFEVYGAKVGGGWLFDGELVQLNDGVLLFCKVVVGDGWGGGTEQGESGHVCFGIFNNTYHDGGEFGGGVFGGLVLVVGGFVGFVNDN